MLDVIRDNYSYVMTAILMAIGLYGMLGKRNLMKKLIGMNIFQTAIILFFVSTAVKTGATVPIVLNHGHQGPADPTHYINPLPHVLMLTAIVVMVSTTGVALAVVGITHIAGGITTPIVGLGVKYPGPAERPGKP